MNTTVTADAQPAERIHLLPLTLGSLMLAALADFLLWDIAPGVGVSIFAMALGAAVLAMREVKPWGAFALLLGAAAASAIELCFTNVCVLAVLLVVLAGGSFYTALPRGWARWREQLLALLCCPGRLPWLAAIWLRQRPGNATFNPMERVSRGLAVLLPAVLVGVAFLMLLTSGNALFGEYVARWTREAITWVFQWDLSGARVLFWLACASAALALLRPHRANPREQPAGEGWRREDPALARMQCVALLVVVNALFLAVNSIDILHGWVGGQILDRTDSRGHLHEGVNSLIVATVLAGVLLAAIFQQTRDVTGGRLARALGHLWIAQNLVLAAGVLLRLGQYVGHSHLLTEKRIYVACFLVLVAAGYVFLVLHIERGPALGRLLWRNTLATFALFYVMQFLDVRGFAADWCARKYAADPEWGFSAQYWSTQGHAAWRALAAAAAGPADHPATASAHANIEGIREEERARPAPGWRSWQWREARDRAALLAGPR